MKTWKLFLFTLPLFTSCISTKKMVLNQKRDSRPLTTENISGAFYDRIDSINTEGLWETLYSAYSRRPIKIKAPFNSYIQLHLESDNRLCVNLISSDQKIDSLKLKGRFKNGLFSVKRKLLFLYTPLLGFYDENKTLLTLDENKNLIILQGKEYHAWVLIGSKSTTKRQEHLFARVPN